MERTETKCAWKKEAYEKLAVERRIRYIIESETNRNRVTAIAMPAGTGKSTYIKRLIANGDEGTIIITDRIKQVKNYFTFTDENGESSEFDLENAIYLTADNLADTMPMMNYKPIVVMTMARYFSLSTDEIIALSRWKNGTRTKVIIDEMPPLIEQEQITMKDLNDVHSAMFEAIDDTSNQKEKEWAISQWKIFRDRIEAQMNKLERAYSVNHDQFYTWFELDDGEVTEDDNRFFSFINANEKQIIKYGLSHNVDVKADINHVQQLRDYGGIYSCRLKKSGEYVKSFTVAINNLDRLIHLINEDSGDGLKVYILDGTADLSPDYRQHFIDIIDCREYYRDLSYLTIHIMDINTSKNALNNYKSDAVEITEIKNHIQTDSLVITYKDYEKMFVNCVANPDKQIAHFGAVRGDNDYNQMTKVIQIGLNRFPPIYYLLLHRELHRDFYDCLFDKPTDEYIDELDRIINNHCLKSDNEANKIAAQAIYRIMEMSLLADIEQNLFRTAIRNYKDNQPIVCTLVFDVKQHTELINQMRNRLESHGATIIVHEKPKSLKLEATKERKAPKGKEKTNAQKVLEYLDGLKHGEMFKVSELLKATGMTNRQLKSTKNMNGVVADKLQEMQTSKKGYYRKP